MKCTNCGAENPSTARFCGSCGSALGAASQRPTPPPTPEPVQTPHAAPAGGYGYNNIPAIYEPLSAWVYFFLGILFCVPVVGFIAALILALGAAKNMNMRNYAKSRFCTVILIPIVILVFGLIFASANAATGAVVGPTDGIGVIRDVMGFAPVLAIIALIVCHFREKRQPGWVNPDTLPPEYRPIGMWGYFGYNILFGFPVIGWIIMLIMALGGASNRNVRSYARSFLCGYILLIIAAIIILPSIGMSLGAIINDISRNFR